MTDSKARLFRIFTVSLSAGLLLPGAAQAAQDNGGEPAATTEVPAIQLHADPATLDAASNAQEVRNHFEKVRADAQNQSRAKLLQINEDARQANEEMAQQSGADWQQTQADYLAGLAKLRELDLDAEERVRREAELAKVKDERLLAIAAEREQRAKKIQQDREARRASEIAQAAEFNADLQAQLSSRVELLQSPQAAATSATLPAESREPRPALPEPRPMPETPVDLEVPTPTPTSTPAKTTPQVLVDSRVDTNPQFDIYINSFSSLKLIKPRLRGALLKADEISFSAFLMNGGEETFAFANNQIDASIIEGYFDFRQDRVEVDRRGVRNYAARGLYDVAVAADAKVEVPLIIKGPRENRVGLWPVPMPNRYGAGLRAVRLSSGEGPVELKPDVWHTVSIRLVPADADEANWQHSAFANIRFDRQGGVQELKGPYVY